MLKSGPITILNTLSAAGYEAYYVGGCVRDHLLCRPIHDWDITTSALPEQTMACFVHCVPTGIKHGTVTVLLDGLQAEVTTFRCDGSYHDGRHPEQVTFVRSLEQDLARRDFTINAMAMDRNGRLVDLYGGRSDLDAKLLRCVGDPERRFREDALRMLRAIRFSAQLGFAIEPQTWAAIERCAPLCAGLSAERIRDEVEKTLLSPCPERLLDMARFGMLQPYGAEPTGDLAWLTDLPAIRSVRWAGLCRLWPSLNLHALRLDRKTARDAMEIGRESWPQSRLQWKQFTARQGQERAILAAQLAGFEELLQQILASGECLSLKELAVSGKDFPDLPGKCVGEILHTLLYHVLEHPEDNQKKILLGIIENSIDYCY